MLIFLAVALLGATFLAVRRYVPGEATARTPVAQLAERPIDGPSEPWSYSPVKARGGVGSCVECRVAVEGSAGDVRAWVETHGAERHGILRSDDAMIW